MRIHQIRYFLAVCNALNFTRAADSCHVSQSSLSRAVKQLEEELDGQLFQREHHGAHMTDLARLLQPHFVKITNEIQTVRLKARAHGRGDAGLVTLGVTPTIGPRHLADLLGQARSMAPGLEIVLTVTDRTKLLSQMQHGLIDLSVMPNADALPQRFSITPLFRERFIVAFPDGHRFENLDEVQLHDLDAEPLIMRNGCEFRTKFEQLASECGIRLRYSAQTHDELWLQSMIELGFGCAVLPKQLRLREGLSWRPLVVGGLQREVILVHLNRRRTAAPQRLMLKLFATGNWDEASA